MAQQFRGLLARRVMSPFKEFVKFAKRHNGIIDKEPVEEEQSDSDKEPSYRLRPLAKS